VWAVIIQKYIIINFLTAVLLHNNKELRSSCGVISWQVMEHPSKPVRIAGRGLR
jgi:hypothetical protein